jgi:hypothetical protein
MQYIYHNSLTMAHYKVHIPLYWYKIQMQNVVQIQEFLSNKSTSHSKRNKYAIKSFRWKRIHK